MVAVEDLAVHFHDRRMPRSRGTRSPRRGTERRLGVDVKNYSSVFQGCDVGRWLKMDHRLCL